MVQAVTAMDAYHKIGWPEYVQQQYLPDKLREMSFYQATEQGMEDKIRQNQELRKRPKGKK